MNNFIDLRDPDSFNENITNYEDLSESFEETNEYNQINDIEDILSELQLETEPPKLPELLETSKYYNKKFAQK